MKSFKDQTIDGMANELTHDTVKSMCKDGKLTPQGRSLAKLMDRIMPDEKVDEWGWNLSRKERAAIKRRAAEKKAAEEKRRPRRVPASRIVGSKGRERGTDRNAARRPAGTGEEWEKVLRPFKCREPRRVP